MKDKPKIRQSVKDKPKIRQSLNPSLLDSILSGQGQDAILYLQGALKDGLCIKLCCMESQIGDHS